LGREKDNYIYVGVMILVRFNGL